MTTRQSATLDNESTESSIAGVGYLEFVWCWPENFRGSQPLLKTQLTIGRSPQSIVRLADARVSRDHAELVIQRGRALLKDLGSTNGTFVNGERVCEAELLPGSIVRFGSTIGVLARRTTAAPDCDFDFVGPGLLGGRRLHAALQPAKSVAPSAMCVLLEGETGTGKERVARAIHQWSGRAGDFIAVNCAAIPAALAEGELFGYRRGAFSGALQSSVGYIRAAQNGTLLLDEIADLPLELQAKLLRFLEEREVTALGETKPLAVNVRVIATVQNPLPMAVVEGRFRADLYARLNGLTIRIPPLRERPEDIPRLFLNFLGETGRKTSVALQAKLVEALCLHPFPLNVRELRQLAERVTWLHGHRNRLSLSHLSGLLSEFAAKRDESPLPIERRRARDEHELRALESQLKLHGGNLTRAAQIVGVSRQRAYRLLNGDPKRAVEVGDRSAPDEVCER